MIERWIDERSKDLAQAPYVTPDKIRADTQSYALTLKFTANDWSGNSYGGAARSKTGKDNGSDAHG